jgi:hypothetical protein
MWLCAAFTAGWFFNPLSEANANESVKRASRCEDLLPPTHRALESELRRYAACMASPRR